MLLAGAYHGGIDLSGAGATGNSIKGNYIGTNSAGDAAVSNETGICLSSAQAIPLAAQRPQRET